MDAPSLSTAVLDDGLLPPTSPPPPEGTILLSAETVTVHFKKLIAVNNVNFTLRAGTLLGLIGPNGAGKTTLLRAIAGLQPIHSGTVKILEQPIIQGDEDAARMIGFTADVPPLYETLTVRQFLRFIAAGSGVTQENTDPAIDFWLEKVWLRDKAEQKVKTLSRGMKQRLGIARTLMPNPQIVLLDEPASGLDPAGRVQFRKLLCDLRDQGKTIIISSHILSDMEEYCTHIGIMQRGMLQRFGTVREISAGVDDGRCGYTIELVEPTTGLVEILAAIDGVSDVQTERLRLVLSYSSDRAKAAELLRTLVTHNVPVMSFSPNRAGLEEAYLRAGIKQVD